MPSGEQETITAEQEAKIIESLSDTASPEQVDEAIQAISENLDTLTGEQLDQIALVVSNAPPEIKKQFEKEINIFGGGLDKYVPTGSTIPVGQRRTLVIVGAVMTAMPVLSGRRK
jgi:hypothetical protein